MAKAATGVPWFVVAALHERESGADFATYLGNGEPLNRVTQLVPKGPRAVYQLGSRRHRRADARWPQRDRGLGRGARLLRD
jgi:lysozyme family protein